VAKTETVEKKQDVGDTTGSATDSTGDADNIRELGNIKPVLTPLFLEKDKTTEIKIGNNLNDITDNFGGENDVQELDGVDLDFLGGEADGGKGEADPLKESDKLDELEVLSDVPPLSFDDFLLEGSTKKDQAPKVEGNEELKEKIKKLKEKINEEN
jgi:hypothetical protein